MMTADEYLELEMRTEYRNEYVNGEAFAMSGASPRHVVLASNLLGGLAPQLKGSPCRALTSDLRIRTPDRGMYSYPDCVVVCGPMQIETRNGAQTVLNPTLIFEVLSPSTEAYDRGLKFEKYRSNETLKEYVLVSQHRILLERFAKQPDGSWQYTAHSDPDETITLSAVAASLKLSDIYDGVFAIPEE